jgi:hypothetical protein
VLTVSLQGDYWSFNLASQFLPLILLANEVTPSGSVTQTYLHYIYIYTPGILGAIIAMISVQLPLVGRKWSLVLSALCQGIAMAMYTQVSNTAGYVGLNAFEYIMQTVSFHQTISTSHHELTFSSTVLQRRSLRLGPRVVRHCLPWKCQRYAVLLGPHRWYRCSLRRCKSTRRKKLWYSLAWCWRYLAFCHYHGLPSCRDEGSPDVLNPLYHIHYHACPRLQLDSHTSLCSSNYIIPYKQAYCICFLFTHLSFLVVLCRVLDFDFAGAKWVRFGAGRVSVFNLVRSTIVVLNHIYQLRWYFVNSLWHLHCKTLLRHASRWTTWEVDACKCSARQPSGITTSCPRTFWYSRGLSQRRKPGNCH